MFLGFCNFVVMILKGSNKLEVFESALLACTVGGRGPSCLYVICIIKMENVSLATSPRLNVLSQ